MVSGSFLKPAWPKQSPEIVDDVSLNDHMKLGSPLVETILNGGDVLRVSFAGLV